jgi:hypothetical protein
VKEEVDKSLASEARLYTVSTVLDRVDSIAPTANESNGTELVARGEAERLEDLQVKEEMMKTNLMEASAEA